MTQDSVLAKPKDNEIELEPAAIGGYLGGVLLSAYANKLTFRQVVQGQILGLIGGWIGQQIGDAFDNTESRIRNTK